MSNEYHTKKAWITPRVKETGVNVDLSSRAEHSEVRLAQEDELAHSLGQTVAVESRYHDRLRKALEALEDEELPLEGVLDKRRALVARARTLIRLDKLRGLHVPAASKHHLIFPTLLALYTREHARPGFSISRLTRILEVPQTTYLRQISRMVEMGLLTNESHPTDARSAHVRLTDHARAMLDNFFEAASRMDE